MTDYQGSVCNNMKAQQMSDMLYSNILDDNEPDYVKNPFVARSQYSDSWPDVKRIALDQGVSRINERDSKGNTPLHYAVWASLEVDNFTLIRALLDLGADPDIVNNEGDDPIDYAVAYYTDGYKGGYKRILDTVKLMFIGYKYCNE